MDGVKLRLLFVVAGIREAEMVEMCRFGLVTWAVAFSAVACGVAAAETTPVTVLVTNYRASDTQNCSGSLTEQESQADETAPDGDMLQTAILELRVRDVEDLLRREVRALTEEVRALAQVVARVGAWEAVGTDLEIAIEDTIDYEYGLVRNGSFRTLTASEWNGGWRVMTSPHMTGDSGQDERAGERFLLGGSMWIWDTRDPRDDGGIYHLYYYYTSEGVVTFTGNERRLILGRDDTGEGLIYRRRR